MPRLHDLPKLNLTTAHEVAIWEADLSSASNGPCFDFEAIEGRLVTVYVRHQGPLEPLRAAGMSTGFDSGGAVSGHIAIRDLPALVALDEVISVAIQPRVHTTVHTN